MAVLTHDKHDAKNVRKFLDANDIGMVPTTSPIITWGKWAYAPVIHPEGGKKRKQWRFLGTGDIFDYERPAKRFHRLKHPLNQFCIQDANPKDERIEAEDFDVEEYLAKLGMGQKKRAALAYTDKESRGI